MGANDHGKYSTYTNYKCRCEECKAAALEVQRSRTAKKRGESEFIPRQRGRKAGPVKHGTVTQYQNGGCRCEECKGAIRAYYKSRKDKGLEPGDSRHGTSNGYINFGCRCDSCRLAVVRDRKESGASRRGALKANYGITPEQWDDLWQSQGEVCASCGDAPLPDSKRRFHVDHNHTTGEVRGILCHGCNVALGLLKEDPERIRSLAAYIEAYQPF